MRLCVPANTKQPRSCWPLPACSVFCFFMFRKLALAREQIARDILSFTGGPTQSPISRWLPVVLALDLVPAAGPTTSDCSSFTTTLRAGGVRRTPLGSTTCPGIKSWCGHTLVEELDVPGEVPTVVGTSISSVCCLVATGASVFTVVEDSAAVAAVAHRCRPINAWNSFGRGPPKLRMLCRSEELGGRGFMSVPATSAVRPGRSPDSFRPMPTLCIAFSHGRVTKMVCIACPMLDKRFSVLTCPCVTDNSTMAVRRRNSLFNIANTSVSRN